jgi:hypothetical protein
MADLLTQDNVDQFRQAMRSVTDTFFKTPVVLRRQSGEEIDLLCGWKPDDAGSYGRVNGETYVQEAHEEKVERYLVSFNRDYLAEKGLVDPDSDLLLISQGDRVVFKGKRHAIATVADKGVFRGVPILVQLTVQR